MQCHYFLRKVTNSCVENGEKEGRKSLSIFSYNRLVKKCKSPPPFIYFIIIFAAFFGRGTDIATSHEKCVKAQTMF